ncbi:multicopper oxidase [Amycolatopsis mediterranei S699]|uniref:Multicopper oxidase n=2 Tax=Amycolatopsis mediterranei TaxID=33910 RepID=A0A9R0UDW1_AMYMS|nr:multicopper oxidase domain-containing protein [Amycolatopsis mediterranei]ADJ50206.1 putative multicopper oxidase [Amycolatopsis mediterranei U32]AEK47203.1 multicopper oxidase [Amycolatopsis mediterranei S699]AFO81914.1 multicopper oxidase [Amycolatopsis mediterranei S699]AGT89043.1 multicopper oxidase [Amycolatopsis mediterranei RB]KDO07545.1 multicopper oxidase [Amycolatopsis mediterranei]
MTEIIERPAKTGPITAPNWGLTKFLEPLRIPPVLRPHNREMITIPMITMQQRLHAELPESTLWTYAGHFPGPTIEVRSGKQLRISWSNEIEGEFPLVAVQGPIGDAPASRPGRELDKPGYSIVVYLVRDDEEDALGLPHGDHEIPLVITDRNLDLDPATGALTRQLLFKFPVFPPAGPAISFSGPFNLVNGVIWPHLDVDARWYRFRLLNAANSRFSTLNLVDENNVPVNDAVRLIGTDGGLLPAPAPLHAGGLTVAPAERFEDHDHVWIALLLNKAGHPELWDLEQVEADPAARGSSRSRTRTAA